jgi:FlgD Ig-like domain
LPRAFPLVLVLVLVAATTIAFIRTEHLKLQPAPITSVHVTKAFAPTCGCPTGKAKVEFRLRRRETVKLSIVKTGDGVVRTVVAHKHVRKGRQVFLWDGRDDDGALVAEGSYRPRVELLREHRSFLLPNPIRVDRTAPAIRVVSFAPATISPDGDGRSDRVTIRYRESEPAKPLLFVNGKLRVRARFPRTQGSLSWYGAVGGRPVRPGAYTLVLKTRDVAGNLSRKPVRLSLRVRYVELRPKQLHVKTGAPFTVRVVTDLRRVAWRLAKHTGTGAPPVLHLRAPQLPGRYTLVVRDGKFTARTALYVRKP